MKLQKAAEILKADLLVPGSVDKLDFQDAEQLGIEALQQLEGLHNLPYGSPLPPLPSETKE